MREQAMEYSHIRSDLQRKAP